MHLNEQSIYIAFLYITTWLHMALTQRMNVINGSLVSDEIAVVPELLVMPLDASLPLNGA